MRNYSDRIASSEKVKELIANGWYPADLHIHTFYSDDVLPSKTLDPIALYEKARKKGMKYITFTDHDSMDAYDRTGWTRPGLVPGAEIKIKDVKKVGHSLHINVYQLNKRQFAELLAIARLKKDIEVFLEYLKTSGLPFVYNHPFWYEHGEKPSYRVIADIMKLFPVTEYNMHRVWQKNSLTLRMAERYGKGLIAATDTHIGDVGKAYTLARGETFDEYYRNIAAGDIYISPQDLTLELLKDELATWVELVFNLDIVRLEKIVRTQVRTTDYFINLFLQGAFTDYPAVRKTMERSLSAIARSGAPAFCYMKLQNFIVFKMNRQLKPYNMP